MGKAHVICCNDMVMYVVLGNEVKAAWKLEQLKQLDYQRLHKEDKILYPSIKEYSRVYYWHTHVVEHD